MVGNRYAHRNISHVKFPPYPYLIPFVVLLSPAMWAFTLTSQTPSPMSPLLNPSKTLIPNHPLLRPNLKSPSSALLSGDRIPLRSRSNGLHRIASKLRTSEGSKGGEAPGKATKKKEIVFFEAAAPPRGGGESRHRGDWRNSRGERGVWWGSSEAPVLPMTTTTTMMIKLETLWLYYI